MSVSVSVSSQHRVRGNVTWMVRIVIIVVVGIHQYESRNLGCVGDVGGVGVVAYHVRITHRVNQKGE